MVVAAQNTNNMTNKSILLAEKLMGLISQTGIAILGLYLVKAFHACKQEDGQSVSSYLLKMKSYLDTLAHLGYAMPKELGVGLILNSLNKDYDQFIQNYNMHSTRKTITELHAMLKLHEKGIPKKAETPDVLAIRKASESHELLKMSGSDKRLEIIQEEDTQPSENTSKEHNEVAPIEVEPQNVKVPIRRSVRIPQAPDRYGYYVDVEEYELGDLNEPPNYKVALADPESDKWHKVINTEMQSMKDNQVWYLVDLSCNGRTVGCKWLYKKKTDMDGNVHTFKAHLGEAAYILGIRIIRDRSKRLIAFSQSDYLEKILKKFRMKNSKNGYTPMMEKPDYRKLQGAKTPTEVQRMQRVPYASAIGSIMYTTVVKIIFKYLRNTKDMVLVYGAKPEDELKVSCYADASFQTDRDNIKSQTGYVFVLNGRGVDWKSAKQSTIAMPMEMLCDNEPALAIASDPGILKGARHFLRKYHYIREVIQEGEIILKKVHIDDNIADPFTKPMPFDKHFEHAMAIEIVHASSLM
nr:hypothetical protein [Tanacetum cinerariifolium]